MLKDISSHGYDMTVLKIVDSDSSNQNFDKSAVAQDDLNQSTFY